MAFVAVAAVALGARPLHAAADESHHSVKTSRPHEPHLRVPDDDDESPTAVLTHVERRTAPAAPAALHITPPVRVT
ncbi:MAG TPA: hypothetical protein VEY89_03650, partial [Candidatus Dormibacteraeota bacterium]|nr:hypothetical protein [Candidatus Dormibacteraeota bacterium]